MSSTFRLMKGERRPSVLVVDDIEANLELMEADQQAREEDIPLYEEKQMKPAVSRGLSKRFLENNSWDILPGEITEQVFQTKEFVEIIDVQKCNYTNNPALMTEKIRSVLAYPVILRGEFAGILYINDFKSRQFSERQKASLALVTGIIALTLDRFALIKGLEECRLKLSTKELDLR